MAWGYMGKVPNRGDFITHDVQPALRDLLFEWCQATMAVSREQLGNKWLDAYLTSPIWHFGAGPGVIADEGVIGTLIPSVDRVGRHFPFVVLAGFNGTALEAWRQPEWSSALEECVLAVLDDDWNEDAWQQRLATIEVPATAPCRLHWPTGEGNLMIPGAARESDWLRALLERNAGMAIWWTQGAAYVEPATLLAEGLPKVGQFAAMLVGRWSKHGWRQGVWAE
jgi:type VI secretion system protein ImpM